MILLDTNVVSEPLRPVPAVQVTQWLDAQPLETLYLSAITVAELRAGVAFLPAGKRRDALQDNLEKRVLPLFTGQTVPFDMACTNIYATLLADARKAGLTVSAADGYIAACAVANGFTVATRDTALFRIAGLDAINPWDV